MIQSSYFTGYISNDYVNEDETVLKAIEKWADTDDKLTYIVGLGVKTERTNLVKCRKSLVNDESLSSGEIENMKDNIKGLTEKNENHEKNIQAKNEEIIEKKNEKKEETKEGEQKKEEKKSQIENQNEEEINENK